MILNRLRLNTLPDSIYLSWVCLKAVLDSAQMDSALSGQRSSWTQRCPCAWLINIFFIFTFLRWCSAPIFFTKNIQSPYEQAKNFTFFCMKMFVNTEVFIEFFSYTVYGHHFMATLRKQSNTSNVLLPGRCKAPRMKIPEE